ncbi:tail fiber domain-containing protein [Citrobacter freundii]
MSAGTLTLTNNSAAVAGSGTAFTTEVAAGDFIVVTVGGVPYTLPVKSVESGTALTLVSNYTGPTKSGAAWSGVPRVALNMVTAALVAQSAEALRGLNYDKQNWQQFFTADGDVTITLPDTSQTKGPSAKKLISSVENKADKVNGVVPPEQGGTGTDSLSKLKSSMSLDRIMQTPTHTVMRSPNGAYGIFITDDNWGMFHNNTAAPVALSTTYGGTGRTDGKGVFTELRAVSTRDTTIRIENPTFPVDYVGGLVVLQQVSSTGKTTFFQIRTDGASAGQISNPLPGTSGMLAVQGTSGRDYKEDIESADAQEALGRVMGLELVNFVYKDDEKRRIRFGVIAEDAEVVAPQYIKRWLEVIPGTEQFDDEGNKIYEETRERPSVDVNPIVMDLLGCVQALQQQITELKTSLNSITAK